MKHHLGLLLVLIIAACNSQNNTTNANNPTANIDLKAVLPGTWETLAFRVNINTFQNTDSTFVMEVQPGEWETKMQTRPILTEYRSDNRYTSTYRNLSDSLLRTERGIWNVFGDTLMLVSPEATYQYEVIQKEGNLQFRSVLDWDGDGIEDDEYIGTQKFIKK
ncbi:MAG: hypothetical protein ACK4TA_16265 [Saprospiraceae bacterium]